MRDMREKMAKLAKQAAKLLAIELFVPGGTLVVLAILLARGRGKSMTDTVMIVGLISALVLNLWGAALSVAPAWAELNASESEVLALKREAATRRAQRQNPSAGTGAEAKRIDLPVTPDCASRPEALIVIEAALGFCK